MTFASAAANPSGATFHSLAATPISRLRAASATRRNCGVIVGVVRLPNVPASNGVKVVSASTRRTLSNGTRNSSAMVCEMEVRMFCPISALPVNPVTTPSSPTCSHEAISFGSSSLWNDRDPAAVSCAGSASFATTNTAI